MELTGPEALLIARVRGIDREMAHYATLEFPNETPDWFGEQMRQLRARRRVPRRAEPWFARAVGAMRDLVGSRSSSRGALG